MYAVRHFQPKFPVLNLRKGLSAKARKEREVQPRDDVVLVHVRDTGLRVVVDLRQFVIVDGQRGVIVGRPMGCHQDAHDCCAVLLVNPGVHTVDAFDMGHAVAVSGRCSVDPNVRRLDDVVVNGDEPLQILFHGYSLGPLCDRPPAARRSVGQSVFNPLLIPITSDTMSAQQTCQVTLDK